MTPRWRWTLTQIKLAEYGKRYQEKESHDPEPRGSQIPKGTRRGTSDLQGVAVWYENSQVGRSITRCPYQHAKVLETGLTVFRMLCNETGTHLSTVLPNLQSPQRHHYIRSQVWLRSEYAHFRLVGGACFTTFEVGPWNDEFCNNECRRRAV
jgi:hypothetical protein